MSKEGWTQDSLEKMMMTCSKHSKGLDLSSVESEFSEILSKAGVEFVIS